jgi:hypothetical protein
VTLRDLCDITYVLLIEQLERLVLSERQIVATLLAAGAPDIEMPLMDEVRAVFDAALIAEPVPESPRAALLRSLGIS